jgi:hypothetical protein
MSNINKESQNIFNQIAGVEELSNENAAAVSGGALALSDRPNGKGDRRTLNGGDRNLGRAPGVSGFNNRASWYQVSGNRDWIVWTGKNRTGQSRRLKAGSKNNFPAPFNNNIESAFPA